MARLAVAAILIFEATNKTSIPCGTSDFNETLASLIFMLVMKNIQKWGWREVKWALHDKKIPFFAQKLRNSKFAINPFTNTATR